MASIPPGATLPFWTILDSLTGFTPVSDAIVIILSLSNWNLAGLSPFLSRTHNAHFPSAITIPAGPSHGSICIELYSWNPLTSGSKVWIFCHAGGSTILIALKISTPPFTKSSIMLSSEEESEPVSLTSCLNFWIFGMRGVLNFEDLAFTQFLFPRIAFISPLCANNLNGWARCHLGLVLVENLWWKTHVEARKFSWLRSK